MLSRRITYYIKALSKNFDVSLLCIKGAEHPHIEHYEKARILRVPLKQGTLQERMEQFERALRRQLESEDYTVVHSFDFVCGSVLADLKKQLGYHLVFEASTLCSQEWPYSPLELAPSPKFLENIKSAENHVASHSDALIVATAQQKKYLQNQGLGKIPVHVLYTPASPLTKKPINTKPYFQLLHLGGQNQYASARTTLNAFNTLPPPLKIQLAFGGHYCAKTKARLNTFRETLNPKGIVVWPNLDCETETGPLCAQANAGLLALELEPRNVEFGGAMPELADFCRWGLPIIAANLPCIREFLNQNEALFFPPGNSTMLAECMKTLASSPKLQTYLSSASLAKAPLFRPSVFTNETLRLYHEWTGKQLVPSETFFELMPDITPAAFTPSKACTTPGLPSSFLPQEQDTIISPPASLSPFLE